MRNTMIELLKLRLEIARHIATLPESAAKTAIREALIPPGLKGPQHWKDVQAETERSPHREIAE